MRLAVLTEHLTDAPRLLRGRLAPEALWRHFHQLPLSLPSLESSRFPYLAPIQLYALVFRFWHPELRRSSSLPDCCTQIRNWPFGRKRRGPCPLVRRSEWSQEHTRRHPVPAPSSAS